jgi:hypothetical protein
MRKLISVAIVLVVISSFITLWAVPVFSSVMTMPINISQISYETSVCSKCGQELVGSEGEQSYLAKALNLTLCIDCWMDVFYGAEGSYAIPNIALLGGDGKVLPEQLPEGSNPTGGFEFPVGAIYLSVSGVNPFVELGYGTWAQVAQGQFLVGLNALDSEFDIPMETGGTKTHTHDAHATADNIRTGGSASAFASQSDAQHSEESSVPPYYVIYIWQRIN